MRRGDVAEILFDIFRRAMATGTNNYFIYQNASGWFANDVSDIRFSCSHFGGQNNWLLSLEEPKLIFGGIGLLYGPILR